MVQCESCEILARISGSSKHAGFKRICELLKNFVKKTCWLGLHNAKAFGITNPVSERGSSGLKGSGRLK
jgi:hypothetical protein